jgi:hypothetical protein
LQLGLSLALLLSQLPGSVHFPAKSSEPWVSSGGKAVIEIGVGWLLAIILVCVFVGILISTYLGANKRGDLESDLYHALSALKTTADVDIDDRANVQLAKSRSKAAYVLITEDIYGK